MFFPICQTPFPPCVSGCIFERFVFFPFLLVARAISLVFLSTLSLHSLSPLSLSTLSLSPQAESVARLLERSLLVLEVAPSNAPALGLYKRIGYVEYDAPPPMLPKWMRGAVAMQKEVVA